MAISGADLHASQALQPLVRAIPPIRSRRGPRRRKPGKLHGDKGYDCNHLRRWLRERGILHRLARKGVESSKRLGRDRWQVERTMRGWPAAADCTAVTSAKLSTSSRSPASPTPAEAVPPLTRPQVAEARRMRAVELLEQGHSQSQLARMLGVTPESVRRWQCRMEQGGIAALRRRPPTGRPRKLTDEQVERIRAALEKGAVAHGFSSELWTLERVGLVVERHSGVRLSRASVWRLLTGRLGWSLQRPQRKAVERDESEIARWVSHEWPRIKRGP